MIQKMVTKYNIITTCGLIICIMGLVWLMTSPNFSCIKKTQRVVDRDIYDSMIAATNKPPRIIRDTIFDTIPGDPIIKWKDKLVPVYKDSLSTVYKDTLKTEDFRVIINDTLQWNQLQYRKYEYETYQKTIRDTIEIEKPVFVPKEVPISHRGLYGGGFVNGYKKGGMIGLDIFLVTKKEKYFGIQGGITTYITSDNLLYYPFVGFKLGKRF